jgi:hypothetical protein
MSKTVHSSKNQLKKKGIDKVKTRVKTGSVRKSKTVTRTLEVIEILTLLGQQASTSINKPYYLQFLEYITKRALTFDPTHKSFVDYQKKEEYRNVPVKKYTKI